ncbi:MAG TPA: S41 family peptidase [Candidatus Methylacidiphilales bacterium]|jgi:hypothetical protein|nr:S41 family peptidase [Candidatus Methylacidiphilales bacterium]
MNILKLTLLSLLVLTDPILRSDPPAGSPPAAPDPLAEALPILQAKYPDFQTLNYKPGDKLSDLIARSGEKISLSAPATATSPAPAPMLTLADNIFYWRLASFTPEKSWSDVATHLMQFAPSTTGVVLDLRSNVAPDDFAGAEQILGFFTSGDPTLGMHLIPLESHFSFHCPIVVLTNNQTTGAAEALAACLQADGALVVGRATAGKMGRFEEQKLTSGQVLRYFVSPVGSEEDPKAVFKIPQHPLPWNHPVIPDIVVTVDDQSEKAALALIKDNQILDVIGESPERHRLSEASLVQGQDPEWDDYLDSLERKPVLLSLPVVHDAVLISALDSLKAIRLSERSIPVQAAANAPSQSSASLQ